MKTYHELPAPLPEARARSHALSQIIKQKIQQHKGKITFADFMELALYHPEYGYYQNPRFELGRHGDFTTAPEISPLFAQCFARQCLPIFAALGESNILELGAGTGRFALDFLSQLEVLNVLPERYYIYEISDALREKQRSFIAAERSDLLSRVVWLTALPVAFSGVIIANEVLDAVPVNLFEIQHGHALERMIVLQNNEFAWQLQAPDSAVIQKEISKLRNEYALADGYQSEINLGATNLVHQLSSCLTKGVILFADYGYGQREYYHPQRTQGTLACFYQHHLHQQPLIYPGLQDITAHVDFTRVIETAANTGCNLLGYTTQSAFLLANDLLQHTKDAEENLSDKDVFHLHQAIKTLTMPMEMGDLIKIMAISRHFNETLAGFTTLDRRRDL